MRQVIVKIEGVGAFRAPAPVIADILETNRPEPVYIVDSNGQTWLMCFGQSVLVDCG